MPSESNFMKKGFSETNREILSNNCGARALMCLNLAQRSLISNDDTDSISIDAIRLLIEDTIESLQRYRWIVIRNCAFELVRLTEIIPSRLIIHDKS